MSALAPLPDTCFVLQSLGADHRTAETIAQRAARQSLYFGPKPEVWIAARLSWLARNGFARATGQFIRRMPEYAITPEGRAALAGAERQRKRDKALAPGTCPA